jgi:hypothetical protein
MFEDMKRVEARSTSTGPTSSVRARESPENQEERYPFSP